MVQKTGLPKFGRLKKGTEKSEVSAEENKKGSKAAREAAAWRLGLQGKDYIGICLRINSPPPLSSTIIKVNPTSISAVLFLSSSDQDDSGTFLLNDYFLPYLNVPILDHYLSFYDS